MAPSPSHLPLSEAQVRDYRDSGFLALLDVFVGEELRRLRDAVATAVERERDTNVIGRGHDGQRPQSRGAYEQLFIQRVNLWTRHPEVKPFVLSARLAELAARLEGVAR